MAGSKSVPGPEQFEKLGAFYLGRPYDPVKKASQPGLILYDSKDLVTHAVCVGMTGSGKTGLCIDLLEEAALDGVPAIAIDPKGDLTNLMLTFPELRPEDFRPWINEDDARAKSMSPDDYAAQQAKLWRDGLAAWGEDGERIRRLRDAADFAIYTPGSSAGIPISILASFAAPTQSVRDDSELLRDRVTTTASSVLGLLGIEADPIQSREHILIANLLTKAWSSGQGLDLGALITQIQRPPMATVGALDLETFYPAKERAQLAVKMNNLLASPGFNAWLEGVPLDVGQLLRSESGKPRVAIVSIAHLSEAERMFFVSLLLNQVLDWARAQSGTTSLRAVLYMDEIFGYFPPTANPPTKTPLLTLLKQGRAFGLGCVLATQNPVDLDYKGLANCGTWFLGRLQTERDKLRVLDGLEGASATSGAAFDRAEMERVLAGLGKRVFLLHSVHADAPQLFQTRWALSYLRGPLTKSQIATLMAPAKDKSRPAVAPVRPANPESAPVAPQAPASGATSTRPVLPAGVRELFLPPARPGAARYAPALVGEARVHFVDAKRGIDLWQSLALLAPLTRADGSVWEGANDFDELDELRDEPPVGSEVLGFDPLPAEARRAKTFESYGKALALHLYATRVLVLVACPSLKLLSKPGEPRPDFLARVRQAAREARDRDVEKLKVKYAPKVAAANDKIRRAEERVRRETAQYEQQKSQSMISVGASLLGALFGRKLASSANVGRATTAARGISRATREKGDVESAADVLRAAQDGLMELERAFRSETEELGAVPEPEALGLLDVSIKPRKSDTLVERVALVWVPAGSA